MKNSTESSHRRLIRPSLDEVKEQINRRKGPPQGHRPKRSAPPDQTHAESFYYVKQMQNRTPMVVVLRDGEELLGTIKWYDRSCLKLNRASGPSLLIYKSGIKYIYKQEEAENRPKDVNDDPEEARRANGQDGANGRMQDTDPSLA